MGRFLNPHFNLALLLCVDHNGVKQFTNVFFAIRPWEEKINGTNFLDWSWNLRIVLKQEKKLLAIDEAMPPKPANNASARNKAAYEKHKNDSNDVTCLILATMSPELQK